MKSKILIIVLVCLWGAALPNPRITRSCNLDPTVINGKLYSFNLPQRVEGHQFLWTNDFVNGNVTLKGQVYINQMLRYDIYNQILTLKFVNQFGSEKIIEVSDAWLTDFTLDHRSFSIIPFDDGKKKICQTIGNGEIRVLYVWKKQMKLDGTSGHNLYRFSKPLRDNYLQINGKTHSYRWNKSFARLFGQEYSNEIRKYLRQHKIKVNKASDSQMGSVMDYCNSIIKK